VRFWKAIVGCSAVSATAWLLAAAPAPGSVGHTVEPGETLWSIAAASNLTTRSVAAANGLPETAQVVAGSTIWVPSVPEAANALQTGVPVTSSQPSTAGSGSGAPPPAGAYTVRAGDTLSGIAARSGISTGQLAWMNGLGSEAQVITGTVLKLPAGAPPAQAQPQPPAPTQPAPSKVPDAEPYATPGAVTSGQIGEIASAHGVSPSLASAIAWQESGFNNNLVSSANARGVMQILPGTWDWIENGMVHRDLDPASPAENVHAGVMYLSRLIGDAGGDPATAVASYYQGGASLRNSGMFPETRRYVDNVLALRSRFGGP
jgi:soluble lytic murein transglycosylase-like protein